MISYCEWFISTQVIVYPDPEIALAFCWPTGIFNKMFRGLQKRSIVSSDEHT